jgi:hypothetical protein
MSLSLVKQVGFFKRTIDRLPPGRLLILGNNDDLHAHYAEGRGWNVSLVSDTGGDMVKQVGDAGRTELFSAVFVFPMVLAAADSPRLINALISCLEPKGGNLFLILLKEDSRLPAGATGYSKKEIAPLLNGLKVNAIQETTLVTSEGEYDAYEISVVKSTPKDDTDSVSFSI